MITNLGYDPDVDHGLLVTLARHTDDMHVTPHDLVSLPANASPRDREPDLETQPEDSPIANGRRQLRVDCNCC